MKAKDFEVLVCEKLKKLGEVKKQVRVPDRYDGRFGRVDLVLNTGRQVIGVEIDRKTTREKSVFKLRQLGADKMYSILRSPFSIKEISRL